MKPNITRKARFHIMASSLILASSMVGCNGAALNSHAGLSAGKLKQMASSQARDAEKAIADHDAGRAIEIAEAAVAANPADADYRTLLGRAYLLGGRYDSASTAFNDALTLGSKDVRTIVNLALIETAQGHAPRARALLTDHMDVLPAADYGLAMAMAGDPNEAVRVLGVAIHDPAAGAKERQNLAYSYALAGHWAEARQMASVDLDPQEAAKRVLGWAQMAQPGAESARVIAMFGVQPRADDAGLPVRLALVAPELNAPIRTADASEALPPAIVQDDADDSAPVDLAAADIPAPAPVAAAPAPETAAFTSFEPVAKPPFKSASKSAEAIQTIQTIQTVQTISAEPKSPYLRPAPKALMKADIPASRPASQWSPVDPSKGSSWVVQLGAYRSPDAANAGWETLQRRNAAFGQFPLVRSSVTLNGQEYHRVAIAGFRDREGADRLCASVRASGGKCFVRLGGPEAAPTRWALAKKPQQMAMR